MEIQDYPNYLIHPDGRVENKKTGRILKPYDNNGYNTVTLRNHSKRKLYRIHRLIAIHYIPNPNNYQFIDHKDGNKLNNNIDNLRWVNAIQNCNSFKTMGKNNTSGIVNISFCKTYNKWVYTKIYYKNLYIYKNHNKQLVLWVKFIHSLSVKQLN